MQEVSQKELNQKMNNIQKQEQKSNKIKYSKLISEKVLKCPSGNVGVLYCTQCDLCSIVCVNQECECLKNHSKCITLKNISPFNSSLANKLVDSDILQKSIQQIGKLIDQLSEFQCQLQKQLKYFGLNQAERNLTDLIIDQNQDSIKWEGFIKSYEKKYEQIKSNWIINDIIIYQTFANEYKKKIDQGINKMFENIKFQHYQLKQVKSRILKDQYEQQKLLKILTKNIQQIKKIQRIYCASKNSFNVQAFHQKCDDKPNLLYLVHNEFDKEYGAYCPCPISKQRNAKWETDQSMKSFIFSIDKNIKANLVKKQFAIKNSNKTQTQSTFVYFGQARGTNLLISEKSNQLQQDNWISFQGQAYQKKYIQRTEIRGMQGSKCKLRQFQVFQITWNDNK